MERHFEKQLEFIMAEVRRMADIVGDAFEAATSGLSERDPVMASRAFESEKQVNELELELDNQIVEFFALQHPVATDLRFMLATQKVVNDLERLSDHCVNVAQSAISLANLNRGPSLSELPDMIEGCRIMLRDSVRSFLTRDVKLANEVLERDDRVDGLNRLVVRHVIDLVKAEKANIEIGLDIIRISRNLERIGDLCCNFAEETVFLVEGRNIKHSHPSQNETNPIV
ncbi:MAG: phosphate signaling complex protein PhoU [Fibrobacterota bacterium]|jgi:phosphate transport system protein